MGKRGENDLFFFFSNFQHVKIHIQQYPLENVTVNKEIFLQCETQCTKLYRAHKIEKFDIGFWWFEREQVKKESKKGVWMNQWELRLVSRIDPKHWIDSYRQRRNNTTLFCYLEQYQSYTWCSDVVRCIGHKMESGC